MAIEVAQRLPRDADLERTRAAFAQARTLPGEVYGSEDVLRLEQRGLFAREWLCVGREADIPAAGDWFLKDLAGDSVIVLRGADGTGSTHNHQDSQHKPRRPGHQTIDTNLSLHDLRNSHHSCIRQQFAEFRNEISGSIFTTADHFDRTDDFAGLRKFLNCMQVREDTGIVYGSRASESSQNSEFPTQQLNRIALREGRFIRDFGTENDLIFSQRLY